ncbi:MAG: esterase family protein [Cyclobacteriaceae bacterium]
MTRFKTTEVSDDQFENGLKFITVKTPNLKGRGDICLYVPDTEEVDLPVVTLLHGVYGSAWIWALKGGAAHTVAKLIKDQRIQPMILVMPSDGLWGDGSAYLPHNSLDFEKWIVEDVRDAVIENLPSASAQSPQFISGLSMGGYGALRLGAKYANQYRGISAHSSITAVDQMSLFVEESLENYRQNDERLEAFEIISSNRDILPPLRFDCGENDLLIEHNRKLHQQLQASNIDHQYEEFEGAHEWTYWQEHLNDTLLFFNNLLKK